MNRVTKRNRLMAQLDSYAAFMPECPPDSKAKLAKEIYRLSREIEDIKKMNLNDLMVQIDEHTDVRPSKLNFLEY